MARYAGRKGLVYLSTTGTGVATSVIGLTTWSLDRTTDKIDTTGFGDLNKTYVQGLPDIKGTFAGNWDDTETKILAASQSTDAVKLYLYPSSDYITGYHYGPAWVDMSMAVDANGAVKVTGNFAAGGSWGSKNL